VVLVQYVVVQTHTSVAVVVDLAVYIEVESQKGRKLDLEGGNDLVEGRNG